MTTADRGGSTSVRGRICSPPSSQLRQTDRRTDGSRYRLMPPYGGGHNNANNAWPGGLVVKALDLRLRRSWVRLPTTRFQVTTLLQVQRRRNGGGDGGARPRNAETTGARVSFRPPPAIFSRIFACCSLNFHCLSLCCLHTIKTSHSVGTTGRILQNKLTKHTSP